MEISPSTWSSDQEKMWEPPLFEAKAANSFLRLHNILIYA